MSAVLTKRASSGEYVMTFDSICRWLFNVQLSGRRVIRFVAWSKRIKRSGHGRYKYRELGSESLGVFSSRSQHSQHWYCVHRCFISSSISPHQTDMAVIDSFKANTTNVDVRVLTSESHCPRLAVHISRAVVPMACRSLRSRTHHALSSWRPSTSS